MTAPWQPLLDWWFGSSGSASEVAAEKGKLWFGKRDSQDLEARDAFRGLGRAGTGRRIDRVDAMSRRLAGPGAVARSTPANDLSRHSQSIFRRSRAHRSWWRKALLRISIGSCGRFSGCSSIWCSSTAKTSRCRTKRFRDISNWWRSSRSRSGGVCRLPGLCRAASEGDCAVWAVSASQCGVGEGVYG